MTRPVTKEADPWRVPVVVAQIPEAGLHREIVADASSRAAMAEIAGLRDVVSASASFDLHVGRDGQVHVTGRVDARVGQTCVVTLEAIENEIHEDVDLTFAPPEQIPQLSDLVDEEDDGESDVPDPPEPISGGMIDLGRVATDALFLAIDPYPRKPGAVFENRIETDDPEDHPFAALKALKPETDTTPGKSGSKGRK